MIEYNEYDEAIKKFASERNMNNVITNTEEDSISIVQYFIQYTKSNIIYMVLPTLVYDLINKPEVVSAIKDYLSSSDKKRLVIYLRDTSTMHRSLFETLIQYSSQVVIRHLNGCELKDNNETLKIITDAQTAYISIKGNNVRCNFYDKNSCQKLLKCIDTMKSNTKIVSLL